LGSVWMSLAFIQPITLSAEWTNERVKNSEHFWVVLSFHPQTLDPWGFSSRMRNIIPGENWPPIFKKIMQFVLSIILHILTPTLLYIVQSVTGLIVHCHLLCCHSQWPERRTEAGVLVRKLSQLTPLSYTPAYCGLRVHDRRLMPNQTLVRNTLAGLALLY
jgi:hypothetical protein